MTATIVGAEELEGESFVFEMDFLLIGAVEAFLAFLVGFSEECGDLERFCFDFEAG